MKQLATEKELSERKVSLEAKLPRIEKDLYWLERYPDAERERIEQQWEGTEFTDEDVEKELASRIARKSGKVQRIKAGIVSFTKEVEPVRKVK